MSLRACLCVHGEGSARIQAFKGLWIRAREREFVGEASKRHLGTGTISDNY